MWHGSLALSGRRARLSRRARSRVKTGPCTIQIYVYARRGGIRTCALTALTHEASGEVAFAYLVGARARCVYETHARAYVCILSETTYTTGVQQTRPVFRVKRERSEREGEREKETEGERESKTPRARRTEEGGEKVG